VCAPTQTIMTDIDADCKKNVGQVEAMHLEKQRSTGCWKYNQNVAICYLRHVVLSM
jgi:hypothetical protein